MKALRRKTSSANFEMPHDYKIFVENEKLLQIQNSKNRVILGTIEPHQLKSVVKLCDSLGEKIMYFWIAEPVQKCQKTDILVNDGVYLYWLKSLDLSTSD